MSLVDAIQKLHTEADGLETKAAPSRQYDRRTFDPQKWETLLAAIDAVHPGEFEPINNAILKSSKTKNGERSTILAVHSNFPTSRTITLWSSGKLLGDGIDLTAILAKVDELLGSA